MRAQQLPKEADVNAAKTNALPSFSLPQEAMLMPGAMEQMSQLQEQFQKLQEAAVKWQSEQFKSPEPSVLDELDEWAAGLEGESLEFVKAQRASMGDEKLLQLKSLLKGKGKGARPGPYR